MKDLALEEMTINGRAIGPGHPTYIIAELSANHGGSLAQALRTIRAMKDAGADAIKLQTYTADTLTIDCDRDEFKVGSGSLWEGRTLHDLYQEAHTPWQWHEELFGLAAELEIDCFSTPFDKSAVEFLESFDPPVYKVASFELVDLPLIRYIASKGRPIIMSTGMGSLAEISQAVNVVKESGVPLSLLKCTSAYPSLPESMNLKTIPHLRQAFEVPTGLSDHTLGVAVPAVAVALGACVIEKHFTLSRERPGPDSAFSLEPDEFREMVDAVRVAEKALGEVNYQPTEKEAASKVFRRSLFVVESVDVGEPLTTKNVRSIRPGYGMSPASLDLVIGRKAAMKIERGTPLQWDLIQ